MKSSPKMLFSIETGQPLVTEGQIELALDLNSLLITHPLTTFFAKAQNNHFHTPYHPINNNDLLIIDRSITPKNNHLIVACLNGEFVLKRLKKISNKIFLLAENQKLSTIEITPHDSFEIWGVVTYIIHKTQTT